MVNDITVAICVYNCEKYIEETLECILGQTFQNFQFLIVNDCSTDDTEEVINNFFLENKRQYELVNFKENRGIAYGRKYVLENVHTDYIIFVDADDKPYPQLVEKLYAKIQSDRDLMAVGCYHEYIDKDGCKIGGGLFLGTTSKNEFLEKAKKQKLIFMQPTAIVNRKAALKVGGFDIEGFPDGKPRYQDLCEDLDLWTRMSDLYTEGKAIIVIPEVLNQYRKMGNTTSTNTFGMFLKMRYIKSNLLKRRANQKEDTFIQFQQSLSKNEIKDIERETNTANLVRGAAFDFRKRKYFTSLFKILKAVMIKPSYVGQKIKSNMIKN